jgi:hypothetical protein
MTHSPDTDLNRLVAEARGWTPNTKVVRTAIAHALVNEFEPPDVCTDPGAWGGLMEECKVQGSVSLSYIEERGLWFATVTREPAIYSGWDAGKPGRALAMAFLGSKERSNA